MWPDRPPRISAFSYRGLHRYFITINTRHRTATFANSKSAREISSQIPPGFAAHHFEVLAYCVMPDHLHLILEGTSPAADLREAVRVWKQRTGYAWKRRTGAALWQSGFHDRVLREGDETHLVVRYVLQNPVRAGLVRTAREYPWLGSSRYTIEDLETHAADWKPTWKRR